MPLLERHIRALDEQGEVLAAMDLGALWDRMNGEFLDEYARLQRQNLTAEELERELISFINGLSDKPVEDLARKSSAVAYNQGRGASLLGAAEQEEVEFVVRSEVLDGNTCEPCAQLDGSVVRVGTPEYDQLMPPAFCDGGDRCRGFYVPVG